MTDTLPIALTWHNVAKEKPKVSGTYLVAIQYSGEIYCVTDITYSAKYDTWNWRDYMGPQPDENRAQWDGRITLGIIRPDYKYLAEGIRPGA